MNSTYSRIMTARWLLESATAPWPACRPYRRGFASRVIRPTLIGRGIIEALSTRMQHVDTSSS